MEVLMQGAVPVRSHVQRMDALARANEIRSYRAQLKRNLAGGRVTAWEVLTGRDDRVATMKVYDVLLALPKVGRVKLNKAFGRANVSPSKTVGGLTERQLSALGSVLRAHVGREWRPRPAPVLDFPVRSMG